MWLVVHQYEAHYIEAGMISQMNGTCDFFVAFNVITKISSLSCFFLGVASLVHVSIHFTFSLRIFSSNNKLLLIWSDHPLSASGYICASERKKTFFCAIIFCVLRWLFVETGPTNNHWLGSRTVANCNPFPKDLQRLSR